MTDAPKFAAGRVAWPVSRDVKTDAVLRDFESALEARGGKPGGFVYVSTPITSGRRYSSHLTREQARTRNVAHAKSVIATLMERDSEIQIIDPTTLDDIPGWEQPDYHGFWLEIIGRWAKSVAFCDGWQSSVGCCLEMAYGISLGKPILDEELRPLSATAIRSTLQSAVTGNPSLDAAHEAVNLALEGAPATRRRPVVSARNGHHELKDSRLDEWAHTGNVAQFVSAGPGSEPDLRYLRIRGLPADANLSLHSAIDTLLRTGSGSVNIRSFLPDRAKGNPFEYGVTRTDEALAAVRKLSGGGYFTIINETIDVHDGGVSGVVAGGLWEVAPDDTPRAVEEPGVAAFPDRIGRRLLRALYGVDMSVIASEGERVEFSLHPRPTGYRSQKYIVWEKERVDSDATFDATMVWPNRLSRHIGDKAFGLLVAHSAGMPVPRTQVISRRVPPFQFGRSLDTAWSWTRTCPTEPRPGHFSTLRGWTDPFELMGSEDPTGEEIASVIYQDGIEPRFSGAALPSVGTRGAYVIEGVSGPGDEFMLGRQSPEELPNHVVEDVQRLARRAQRAVGSVRIEWVHDGTDAWLVQLQLASAISTATVIVAGEPSNGWVQFDVLRGLDDLLSVIKDAVRHHKGVVLEGNVGVTSHFGDVLRRAKVPSRLARSGGDH